VSLESAILHFFQVFLWDFRSALVSVLTRCNLAGLPLEWRAFRGAQPGDVGLSLLIGRNSRIIAR
jgi:hypothetical protein